MKYIKSFAELRKLPKSTKINKIHNGNIDFFIIAGTIKQSKGVILVSESSYKDIFFLYQHTFERYTWTIGYNRKLVGLKMIQQVEKNAKQEIENIKAVYLDKK